MLKHRYATTGSTLGLRVAMVIPYWASPPASATAAQDTHQVWSSTTQTNILRPAITKCRHCGEAAATSLEAPTIWLIS